MYGRRMLERSKRLGRDRQVGFTPVRNERIAAAVDAQAAIIQIAEIEQTGRALSGAELMQRAWNAVARTLPAGRMRRDYTPRVTRNNDPAYRGIGGAGPQRQRALGL